MEMRQILTVLVNDKNQACQHTAFINNTCAGCKQPMNNCDNPTTIPLGYIHPKFSLTIEAIRCLRDHNFKTLLNRKKLHLVLDLDSTLVHSTKAEKSRFTLKNLEEEDVYKVVNGYWLVKLRPGICDFLKQASTMFDLSICTMAKQEYGREVARLLESKMGDNSFQFSSVIAKDHCTMSCQKRLDVVLSYDRMVLIVDDREEVWGDEHKANLIKIKPYKFFRTKSLSSNDDQELASVLNVLRTVHNNFYDKKEMDYASKDVRQVLENVKNGSIFK